MKIKIFSAISLAVLLAAGAFAFLNRAPVEKSGENKTDKKEVSTSPKDPHQLIEGTWIVEDYTFKRLSEEARGTTFDLEDVKRNKTKIQFKDGRVSQDGKITDEAFDIIGDKVYLWDYKESNNVQTVIKSGRVGIYKCQFLDDNKMKWVFAMDQAAGNIDIEI